MIVCAGAVSRGSVGRQAVSLDVTAERQGGAGAEPSGLVFNVMRFSLHDGPGIRTTVFLKGCPLSCWWCHNPESRSARPELVYFAERCRLCGDCVTACPECAITIAPSGLIRSSNCRDCGACVDVCLSEARELAGRQMTVSGVLREIERDLVFFDESGGGGTFSGGEPLHQADFLDALLTACRERRIHTVLDTCGFAHRDVFVRIASKADLVLYDLKSTNLEKHRTYTGVSNQIILENLEALTKTGRPVVLRLPIIPGINDSDEEVAEAVALLTRLGIRRVDLLPYHHLGLEKYRRLGLVYQMHELAPPPSTRMAQIAKEFDRAGIQVREER
jgi:pyruvate formate lyase activating enzyme